jgi:UDP-N-acetylglucosamine acyltransferase
VIDRRAEVDSSAKIGPGAVIGPNVKIGAETAIGPYVVIESNTTIGRRNQISQFASLGTPPQDLKYKGEPSSLEIGDDNQIFEFTTLHRGTEGGGMVTRVGNHAMLMNYVHIAHDVHVGDRAVITNSTNIAGHCHIDEWAIVEGMCGVAQFVHIGAHAFVAGGSRLDRDVPPYSMVAGAERARLIGINEVGLTRRNFAPESIAALKSAIRTIFYSKLRREEAIEQVLGEFGALPEVHQLVDFINQSKRGVVGRERE